MVSLCPRPAPRHVRVDCDVSPARAAMASLLGRGLLLWLVLVLVLFKWEWEGIRLGLGIKHSQTLGVVCYTILTRVQNSHSSSERGSTSVSSCFILFEPPMMGAAAPAGRRSRAASRSAGRGRTCGAGCATAKTVASTVAMDSSSASMRMPVIRVARVGSHCQ